MSFKEETEDRLGVEPTPQSSNSFNMLTNPFQYPMYSVPQPNYFASFTPRNMAPGPGQPANILIPPFPPPFPPPYPPPFRHHHSAQVHSNDSQSRKSFLSPLETGPSALRFSNTYEAGACTKYCEEKPVPAAVIGLGDSCSSSNSKDEAWLQRWLSDQQLIKRDETKKKSPVKIHEVKEHFKECLMLLQELEHLKKTMLKCYKDADELSWRNLTAEFIKTKDQVTGVLSVLPCLSDLQKVIGKRYKKRNQQKTGRAQWKEIKRENKEKRFQLHHQIDTWLQDMQKAIDLGKREESLKKEADSVLSDVLRKKAEGRRQLSLVTALAKLRQLRAKSAANKGLHVSVDEGIRFTKIAEHLKKLWERQLEEYNVEEQGMRVMLSEAIDERDQSQVTQERRILSQWNRLLFGADHPLFPGFYLAAERDGETFIAIREAWDRWIAAPDAPVKSNIPIGWVLPSNPSSPQWEKFLFT